ncbi:hypothetical protein 65p196 [Aeromonas phage 65]|uniref:Uncharacterized protein n=2 Tax=Ishigurovirus osborne TaxID=260149 RepID=A0A219YC45_9CAUD|nr:hypothetical protein ST65p196 [Aeromonas phage 65]ADQ53204.1 hypothetical protein 65p196 [Aeromonas phage 65]APU01581.1 hypothetical protein [Aeromonas phage 65.2]
MKEYVVIKEVSGYIRGYQTQTVLADSEEEAIEKSRDLGDWSELNIVRDDTETQDIWCMG